MDTFSLLADLLDEGYELTDALRFVTNVEFTSNILTDLPTSSAGLTSGRLLNNAGVVTVA